MAARQIDTPHDELERLRAEVAAMRAVRMRLVLAADADCRQIERELHDGAQQQLIALAVKIQLVSQLVEPDPAAAKALVEEMERDVREALAEAARLAQRIAPPLLGARGLAAALRSAAVSAGLPASVEVTAGSACAPEMLRTVYLCWLEALEHAGGEAPATVTVREEGGVLTFDLVTDGQCSNLDSLRDRVEALGGRLTIEPEGGRGTHIHGSLPPAR